MTDEEFEGLKSRLEELEDRWLTPLGLLWWRTEWVYCRGDGDFPDSGSTDGDPYQTSAMTHVKWEYLDASVYFNMPQLFKMSEEQLEYTFLHECMHILLAETRAGVSCDCDFDGRHEERVCTTLAKAFQWTRIAGRDEAEEGSGEDVAE